MIISDNALEHALEPWCELRAMRPLLNRGGRLHIVVPCDNVSWSYKAENIDQRVYSWSPQSIGNLVKAAGFEVEYSAAEDRSSSGAPGTARVQFLLSLMGAHRPPLVPDRKSWREDPGLISNKTKGDVRK